MGLPLVNDIARGPGGPFVKDIALGPPAGCMYGPLENCCPLFLIDIALGPFGGMNPPFPGGGICIRLFKDIALGPLAIIPLEFKDIALGPLLLPNELNDIARGSEGCCIGFDPAKDIALALDAYAIFFW